MKSKLTLILAALAFLPASCHPRLYPAVIVTDRDGALVYDTLTPSKDHE
jgi:hypothetical protein